MLNGHETLLSHGWHPETGFIKHRWAEFSEAMILYILGLGAPTPVRMRYRRPRGPRGDGRN